MGVGFMSVAGRAVMNFALLQDHRFVLVMGDYGLAWSSG